MTPADEQLNRQPTHPKPLVLGVGNLLMGDEGIGIAALRYLEKAGFANHADLVDGGTGGFHLLSLLRDYSHIILIDAALDGKPPGTVSLLKPRFASDFPPSLTAHDIGLKDLIESAALLGHSAKVDLITISIAGFSSMTLDLSEPVKAAFRRIQTISAECIGWPEFSSIDVHCGRIEFSSEAALDLVHSQGLLSP